MSKDKIIDFSLILFAFAVSIAVIVRCFFGTEITDEAYYISDAIKMIHGNIPYAYNNYSFGTGSAFLIIPFVFLYELVFPNMEGVVIFTRICFMLFWYLILFTGYLILRKSFDKRNALLVSILLIPYTPGPSIFNFSYNTIPCALAYLSAMLLYDAIENKSKHQIMEYISTGFLMCVAVFAQPGYALGILTFIVIIFVRVSGIGDKFKKLMLCAAGFLLEVAIVIIPIICEAGWGNLKDGIFSKLVQPSSSADSTAESAPSLLERFFDAINRHKSFIPILVIGVLVVVVITIILFRKKKMENLVPWMVLLSLSVAGFRMIGLDYGCWRIGFLGSLFCLILLACGKIKRYPILLYLAIYPILFSAAEIVAVNSSAFLSRFTAAVPTLVPFFLIFLEKEREKDYVLRYISLLVCIIALLAGKYSYVYRDEEISQLTDRVESGVFKGIYTTPTRAKDLPKCEEYLNSVISDNVRYSARDNVPFAYLMIHNGEMIDVSTWDCLQYHYGRNNPDNLFLYYKRRDAIPEKIVYLNFGRDENLSIEKSEYSYNDFVNRYYEIKDDFCLNDTFFHVIIYEYTDGFDGNYDYWINR